MKYSLCTAAHSTQKNRRDVPIFLREGSGCTQANKMVFFTRVIKLTVGTNNRPKVALE